MRSCRKVLSQTKKFFFSFFKVLFRIEETSEKLTPKCSMLDKNVACVFHISWSFFSVHLRTFWKLRFLQAEKHFCH